MSEYENMRTADIVSEALLDWKVNVIFGLPGDGINGFMEALRQRQNKIRFGGTMEMTSLNTPPKMKRVKGILESIKKYFPEFDIPMPSQENIWHGYRPCSADGLPYIGKAGGYNNLVVATGHSMLGLSLGAGTGKLVSEIINAQPLSMNIAPFNPDRFLK